MRTVKTAVFWAVIFFSAMLLWQIVRSAPGGPKDRELTYSGFMSDVDLGAVVKVKIVGTEIRGKYRNGSTFHLRGPDNPGIYLDTLRAKVSKSSSRMRTASPFHCACWARGLRYSFWQPCGSS